LLKKAENLASAWFWLIHSNFFALYAHMFFVISFSNEVFPEVPSPDDLDYLSGILAFAMEGFMFSEHAHDRSPLDQKVSFTTLGSLTLSLILRFTL
jgi:hypothetical protein